MAKSTRKLSPYEAAQSLQGTGKVQPKALRAWLWLRMSPKGLTAQELEAELAEAGDGRGYWRRLSELRNIGLVVEAGMRPCRITRRQAIVWKAVFVDPTPPNHRLRCRTCKRAI